MIPVVISQRKHRVQGEVTGVQHKGLGRLARAQYLFAATCYLTGPAKQDAQQIIPARTRSALRRVAVLRREQGRGLPEDGQLMYMPGDWRLGIGCLLVRAGQGKSAPFIPINGRVGSLDEGRAIRIILGGTDGTSNTDSTGDHAPAGD